jgi:hypothetical protein
VITSMTAPYERRRGPASDREGAAFMARDPLGGHALCDHEDIDG